MKETNRQTSLDVQPAPAETLLEHLDVRVVVFSLREEKLQVLLAPASSAAGHRWGLPGSPIPASQSLEETATESVLRLTGLREAYLEQLYTYGESWRVDDTRDPPIRLVSVVYFAIIPAGAYSASTDKDERQAKWFPIEALPEIIAKQNEVIGYALRRLRYKVEYTAIGFQLLPEQFSLSELQKTYEMILGEQLDKRNFRRRILQAGIIEETPHRRSGEGRPARLFRYQPDAVAEIKTRRLFP